MNRADLEVDINDEYIVDIWFHSDSILTVEPSGETFFVRDHERRDGVQDLQV